MGKGEGLARVKLYERKRTVAQTFMAALKSCHSATIPPGAGGHHFDFAAFTDVLLALAWDERESRKLRRPIRLVTNLWLARWKVSGPRWLWARSSLRGCARPACPYPSAKSL